MILYPAIDLKEGRCVRLVRGDMAQATVFNDDPAAQAASFAGAGAAWLHLVDLDGAFAGKPINARAVEAIVDAVDIPVQLGGGIRTLETIENWLDRGVKRVIDAFVPLRNMFGYSTEIRSLSQGRATFSMTFHAYAKVA